MEEGGNLDDLTERLEERKEYMYFDRTKFSIPKCWGLVFLAH